MSNLTPEVRVNKNGVPVIKHVKMHDDKKSSLSAIPAPADPAATRQVLPALKGKRLKEAKEIQRLAQNGEQEYEDAITGAFLGNDLRFMQILSRATMHGSYSDTDSMINIVQVRMSLGYGADEDVDTFVDRTHKYNEMTRYSGTGPVISEDFDPRTKNEESDRIIGFVESNWDDFDELVSFFGGREMEEYTADYMSKLWSDYKNFAIQPLRDGFI
jgi:hypothetical protein